MSQLSSVIHLRLAEPGTEKTHSHHWAPLGLVQGLEHPPKPCLSLVPWAPLVTGPWSAGMEGSIHGRAVPCPWQGSLFVPLSAFFKPVVMRESPGMVSRPNDFALRKVLGECVWGESV